MSRSGYTDDYIDDHLEFGRWRGMVTSAIKGKRGQTLLRELAEAMDSMQVKELIEGELQAGDEVCALGAVGKKRGISMDELDPEDSERVAEVFNIAPCLAQEIAFINDEDCYLTDRETPAQRWQRVRRWVARQISGGGALGKYAEEEAK